MLLVIAPLPSSLRQVASTDALEAQAGTVDTNCLHSVGGLLRMGRHCTALLMIMYVTFIIYTLTEVC